jgi:hypothetical protein
MTNSEIFSIIIRCSLDTTTNTTQLHVTRTDTGEVVQLRDAAFLVRISIDRDVSLVRCHVRHLTSGREAYVQSSTQLESFILACLLEDDGTSDTSTSGPQTPQEPTGGDSALTND